MTPFDVFGYAMAATYGVAVALFTLAILSIFVALALGLRGIFHRKGNK